MVKQELKCSNGTNIKFEKTPYYFKLTIGRQTWYWNKDTGEFDGTLFDMTEN